MVGDRGGVVAGAAGFGGQPSAHRVPGEAQVEPTEEVTSMTTEAFVLTPNRLKVIISPPSEEATLALRPCCLLVP